mmetsp:Transcript_22231/g.26700  ORF Transcript_22231/g.26700 Transcript_22231/m.26700 type:complete len:211 (-) Transcript_22231:301-933(-)|eukprot:CAMPEP_0197853736 /NCGR_PEP_ID=MMETSP1438-20131217/23303_1 /TAXON_ID=1461541 /ORGANISM="Pterosperma sp., Strain CCMP1384" /LENGTH=210 /DNA_ID=CAMNT_0043468245 /DNA_START=399 /DNA_END=1031 /DNA_ORIENTATION=+
MSKKELKTRNNSLQDPAYLGESCSRDPWPGESPSWLTKLLAKDSIEKFDTLPIPDPPSDSIIGSLERAGLVKRGDVFVFDTTNKTFYGIWSLGRQICGHPGIVHGGVISLIMDDTIGRLFGLMKVRNALPSQAPGVTAKLSLKYHKPLKSFCTIVVCASLKEVAGRKVRLFAELRDGPDGDVFASADTLFVSLDLDGAPTGVNMGEVVGE